MYIDQLTVWNFRSFGATAPEATDSSGTSATIVKLDAGASVFIGRNGAGKSSLVQALLRLFGEARDERTLQPADFFVLPTERLESQRFACGPV